MLSNAKRAARRDASVNFGACGGRKHAAVSTSPANSDDKLGQVAQSFRCAKDESLLSALPSVMTGDGDVKRSQTTVCVPPNERQIHRPPRELPQRGLIPARVSSRGYVDLGMPTPMLRRPGYDVKKLLVTTAIAATVAGSLVIEILDLVEDSDHPGLPEFTSRVPPLPQAVPPSTGFSAIMTGTEAERITQGVSLQPTVSSRPTAQSENQPTESRIEVTLPQMAPGSEYEKIVGKTAATPEPPAIAAPELTPIARSEPGSIATPESIPIARQEPTPESPPINRAPPHIENVVVADRAGFLFADSNVRYLTRAELQKLSADRLHIARNEIFARKGRYFKDDALRTYFSQFPWYQPHAWDVPLSPVERNNVGLIQSIEAPAAAPGTVMRSLPAQTKAENGVTFADPSRQYLTPEELQGLSADQLVIVRNEIFARKGRYFKDDAKGRYFKDDALRAYFSQFPWYRPHAWDVPLSPVEQANVKLLHSFEQTASTAWRVPPM